MPTYEYEGRKCGHTFERFQSITAPPVKTCPKCKGKVARLLSGGAGITSRVPDSTRTITKKTSNASHAGGKTGDKKAEGGNPKPSRTSRRNKRRPWNRPI
jgi:putative FmdB family regulatory protein